jgi:hypothetical protein
MTTSAELRTLMPELCRHEGVWEGEYLYITPDAKIVDRHGSRLLCRTRDLEGQYPYDQTNISLWDDGREMVMHYPATFKDGRIWFDDKIIKGSFAEINDDDRGLSIFGSWIWTDLSMVPFPTTDMVMFELIQSSKDGQHRSRTWHWIDDGKIVLRTLISERKVSDDWRAWEAAHPLTAPLASKA